MMARGRSGEGSGMVGQLATHDARRVYQLPVDLVQGLEGTVQGQVIE